MTRKEIKLKDKRGEFAIHYASLREYHLDGNYAMLGAFFQGIKGAFALLSPNEPIQRDAVSITSGHPGSGVRDAFEFVTRCVSRGDYTLDTSMPHARYNPHKDMSYSFLMSFDGRNVLGVMKSIFLPERFFELFKPMLEGTMSKEEIDEFDKLKEMIENEALQAKPEDIFDYEVR